jgi:hypothetical protein
MCGSSARPFHAADVETMAATDRSNVVEVRYAMSNLGYNCFVLVVACSWVEGSRLDYLMEMPDSFRTTHRKRTRRIVLVLDLGDKRKVVVRC